MIKTDLNDFAWFVHVVEEGGFAAAGGYSCCVPIPARAITFRTCVGRFFDGRVCADGGRVTCSSFIDLMDAKKAG